MSFFAPPPSLSTAVFTRLPERYRRPRPTAWAKANRGGQEIDLLPRRPRFRSRRPALRHRHPFRPHLPHLARRRMGAGRANTTAGQRAEDTSRRPHLHHLLQARDDAAGPR